MLKKLSKAICRADEKTQVYVGYCEECKKYLGYQGNMINTKYAALRINDPDLFTEVGLKPIKLK